MDRHRWMHGEIDREGGRERALDRQRDDTDRYTDR